MRPDQRWFPTSRTERAAWFNNFAQNFGMIGSSLGFSAAEVASVHADNAVLRYAASTIDRLTATMRGVREFERLISQGDIGLPQPEFPLVEVAPMPAAVPPGIFERLEKLVRRIRVAPNYTAADGAALGIIPRNPSIASMADFTPKLSAKAAATPYTLTVRCPRGKFSGFEVSIQRAGRSDWEMIAVLTSSPATIAVRPTTPGQPEMIRVRTQMRNGNYPVGNYSDLLEVTLNGGQV